MRKALELEQIDGLFRLSGDEDCGVGIDCRECDRGGAPVAYYAGISPAHETDDDIDNVDSIAGLVIAARRHGVAVHGWPDA